MIESEYSGILIDNITVASNYRIYILNFLLPTKTSQPLIPAVTKLSTELDKICINNIISIHQKIFASCFHKFTIRYSTSFTLKMYATFRRNKVFFHESSCN
ncbi:hypothetical protein HHI36_009665 [Cryptolaemus montrouzieri]|uniref:Uncharacterized protein n=1 Tax=Cryptolaemus montrouzieri TaxID=559131 RepID=A0ABD2MGF1_9CUCU